MSLRAKLPPRDYYSNPARHRAGRRTPAWPRWTGEGSACPVAGCTGRRTTQKFSPRDSGLTTRDEWRAQLGAQPTDDLHAGAWTCDGSSVHDGDIWLAEVEEDPDA